MHYIRAWDLGNEFFFRRSRSTSRLAISAACFGVYRLPTIILHRHLLLIAICWSLGGGFIFLCTIQRLYYYFSALHPLLFLSVILLYRLGYCCRFLCLLVRLQDRCFNSFCFMRWQPIVLFFQSFKRTLGRARKEETNHIGENGVICFYCLKHQGYTFCFYVAGCYITVIMNTV